MKKKTIKAWAIIHTIDFPENEIKICGTLNSLVRNYAIFEDKKTAKKTLDFVRIINPKWLYRNIKVVPCEIVLKPIKT